MRRSILSLFIALALAPSAYSQAEYTQLVPTNRWNSNAVPKSPSQVSGAYTDGIDAVAWWVNLFAEQTVRKRAETMLRATAKEAARTIEWTGEGALLTVRLIQQQSPESPLKAVGVLGDRAFFVGSGNAPDQALFENWRIPQWRAAIPDGWSEHPLGESYMWVTLEPNGSLRMRPVPRGLARDLQDRLRDDYGRVALEYAQRSWAARDRWESVARRTKATLASVEARSRVDSALASVLRSEAVVAKANADLGKALERERRAANTLQTLRILQGVVSVAQLVQEARTMMDEPLPELSRASSSQAVVNTMSTTKDSIIQERVAMAARFEGSRQDLQKFLDLLGSLAKQAGAPDGVQNKMKAEPLPQRPLP